MNKERITAIKKNLDSSLSLSKSHHRFPLVEKHAAARINFYLKNNKTER
jgi:hypothetical protein